MTDLVSDSISLRELMLLVREAIEDGLPSTYWVRAEIASLSAKPGGHCYLELIDQGARVRANCWANMWTLLSHYFLEETGAPLQVGQQVMLEVTVDMHPQYGLSLNVKNICPAFTLGEQARQRQETIRQLTEQGMLELQRQLPLPTLLRRVAVISAADAAGYQDFVHQLEASPYRFHCQLFPAVMQGTGAPASIMQAMDAALEENWDVCVIIRGGGATTDLSCFDDRELCLACAQYPLPILSGIGHTRDVSILDMVAYLAVKTPTAAAEWLVSRMDNEAARLQSLLERLRRTAVHQVTLRREQLTHLWSLILTLSPERIYRQGYSLAHVVRPGEEKRILRSTTEVQPGDVLEISLPDGLIRAKVL